MSLIAFDGQIELEDDDWLDDEPEDDDDEWECAFPDECLMPSINHMRGECFTAEMARQYQEKETNEPEAEIRDHGNERAPSDQQRRRRHRRRRH